MVSQKSSESCAWWNIDLLNCSAAAASLFFWSMSVHSVSKGAWSPASHVFWSQPRSSAYFWLRLDSSFQSWSFGGLRCWYATAAGAGRGAGAGAGSGIGVGRVPFATASCCCSCSILASVLRALPMWFAATARSYLLRPTSLLIEWLQDEWQGKGTR